MDEFFSTTCTAPSEPLLCAACFTLLEGPSFYDDAALEGMRLDAVPPDSIARLCAIIESRATGIEELFEGYLTALRNSEQRHKQGMVFTPEPIVRAMVADTLEGHPDRVIDCGCGAGRFALCTAQMASFRHQPVEVMAFDADPLACLLTATAAKVTNSAITVICGDFVLSTIDKIAGTTAFIGNPPFRRHHCLSKLQKETGKKLASTIGMKDWSGLSGMHVLFMAKCIASCKSGDSIRFITGSEWLEVNYGQSLRDAFTSKVGGGSRLVQFSPLAAVFGKTQSTALISFWEPQKDNLDITYDFVSDETTYPSASHASLVVGREALRRQRKWSFDSIDKSRAHDHPHDSGLVELGSLFRVSRGAATGGNKFFVLSRGEAMRRDLEPYCVPIISRASDVPSDGSPICRSKLPKMLFAPSPKAALEDATVQGYLALGEAFGVNQRFVTSHRNPWWHIKYSPAPIVATYMGRNRPRFSLNPESCPTLNTVHGLYPKRAFSQHQLALIVDYLNHGQLFGDGGRVYQGGLKKFEPKEMERIMIPALEILEQEKEASCMREISPTR